MTLCTWTPECPHLGHQRMENASLTGGGVEFVCDHHVAVAEANGYTSDDARPAADAR